MFSLPFCNHNYLSKKEIRQAGFGQELSLAFMVSPDYLSIPIIYFRKTKRRFLNEKLLTRQDVSCIRETGRSV